MTTTPYRIAVGGIAHETHSFATRPTGLDDFRKQALFFGDDILSQLAGGKSATAGVLSLRSANPTASASSWIVANSPASMRRRHPHARPMARRICGSWV